MTRLPTTARAGVALGLASLALAACGRDTGDTAPTEQGEAIEDGPATGTIEVWAMGTEGEILGDFAAAFADDNPDAEVEVTAVPWDSAHEKIANAIASGETPDVTLVGTTWMGEFAQSGGLDPLPEDLVDPADFEKANPDVEVDVTAIPWDAAHNKIANAIASGETPDVSLVGTTWMGEFAAAGGLMPTPEGLVDEADFFPGAWGSTEVGGTSYGVPWYVETRVLYYRKDMAEKAGWSKAPETWDELHQFATDMKEKGGADYGLSLQPGQTGSWQSVLPFAWSNGATVTDEAGAEYTIDSPEMVEALDYYTSYFDEGLSPSRLLDAGELESGFADGTYGSFISGPWHTGLVEEQGVDEDEYAVAPLPGRDGAPGTSFVGGGDLAVFADSDIT